ncbi:MAG: excinuclease ABC subunit UvrC [Chloroflexota bacterium]
MDELRNQQLTALPPKPGVYLFKDQRGQVIYVGKASSLRHRVRSYFQSRRHLDPKTRELVSHIADFDVIRTGTSAEALILENELVKRYQPRFNVMLRDGKTYPYIRITNEEWPRVFSTRRIVHDGSRYFGPFTSAGSVHKTLDLLKRLFPYRPCDIEITGNADRPCLYFHIGRCLGPCIGAADHDEYMRAVEGVELFLTGRADELIPRMREEMEEAAENLEFERAAKLRDELSAIEHVLERQNIVSARGADSDVLAIAQTAGGDAGVQVAFVRNGKMLGSEHFAMQGTRIEDDPADILGSFVTQYYEDAAVVPAEIILQHQIPDAEDIQQFLEKRRGRKVSLTVPQRGRKRKLVEMAAQSAADNLQQHSLRWLNNEQKLTAALSEIADSLLLPGVPRRIECYDISTLQGTNTVGSMVVFEDGKPAKKEYRRFAIRDVDGQDDFAAMREVVSRRFKRALAEEATESWRSMPDLVIIDGGKGQLNAARSAIRELEVDVPVVGLAKENEELFLPDQPAPVILPRDSQALYLVQRIRDEAHRFAVTYQRQKRSRRAFRSELDDLRGVGPKRKQALIRRFGSVKRIREASVADIADVEGIGPALAEEIHRALQAS